MPQLPAQEVPDSGDASGPRFSRDNTLQALPLQFVGAARDYFGVWLVNVLLTLCTLGIWSAWAKVRTRRWFYGHTRLAGAGFDYHATGGQILKGRLLAIALLVGISVITALWPRAERALTLLFLAGMPWAINAGLRFNACMTSWSNVRFDFRGRYGRALLVFVLIPLASVFTLGLLAPLATQRLARYTASSYRFGAAAFSCAPRLGTLYAALLRSMALLLAVCLLGLLITQLVGTAMIPEFSLAEMLRGLSGPLPNRHRPLTPGLRMFLAVLPVMLAMLYAAVIVAAMYYSACAHNETLSRCALAGGHRLHSDMAPLRYIWITLSGLAASLVSVGLAYPWARVRRYRYVAQCITVLAAPGLDEFISQQPARRPGAFGAELSQLEGFAVVSSL
ncbi:YjgN family protein [Achromobacter pulmonis]|uniref:YjgN family protein n=1 Tax=Achromobacter pulmonis TaxID=1389932 RepID=UPI001F232231|nr:YjgN family protein [Achromobacter pulmonis]MCF7766502.1 DUF898 domain-containing protein [Achromobacter pulmonis]